MDLSDGEQWEKEIKKRASAVSNLKSKLQIIPDVSDFQSFLTELSPKRPAFLIKKDMPVIPNDNTLPSFKEIRSVSAKVSRRNWSNKANHAKEWKSTGKIMPIMHTTLTSDAQLL